MITANIFDEYYAHITFKMICMCVIFMLFNAHFPTTIFTSNKIMVVINCWLLVVKVSNVCKFGILTTCRCLSVLLCAYVYVCVCVWLQLQLHTFLTFPFSFPLRSFYCSNLKYCLSRPWERMPNRVVQFLNYFFMILNICVVFRLF